MGSTPEVVSIYVSKAYLNLWVTSVLRGSNAYYLILKANFGAKKDKTEKMKTTLYNLTKKECITLTNSYNTNELALLLYNKGKAKTLESGIKKAIKIKKFANSLVN